MYFRILELPLRTMDIRHFLPTDKATKGTSMIFHDISHFQYFSYFSKKLKTDFFVKGPFWDKLSETTFETASNHSPAKEETVSLLPFEASSLSSPLMTYFFLLLILLQNSSPSLLTSSPFYYLCTSTSTHFIYIVFSAFLQRIVWLKCTYTNFPIL